MSDEPDHGPLQQVLEEAAEEVLVRVVGMGRAPVMYALIILTVDPDDGDATPEGAIAAGALEPYAEPTDVPQFIVRAGGEMAKKYGGGITIINAPPGFGGQG